MKCFAVVCQFMYIFLRSKDISTQRKQDRKRARHCLLLRCIPIFYAVPCVSFFFSSHICSFTVLLSLSRALCRSVHVRCCVAVSSATIHCENVVRSEQIHVIYSNNKAKADSRTILRFSSSLTSHAHYTYTHAPDSNCKCIAYRLLI